MTGVHATTWPTAVDPCMMPRFKEMGFSILLGVAQDSKEVLFHTYCTVIVVFLFNRFCQEHMPKDIEHVS